MNYKKNTFDKLWTHCRDTKGDFGSRAFLHLIPGFFMGLLPFTGDFSDHLIFYEENEDVHTLDEAWKDEAGILTGYVIGKLVQTGIIIYLLVYFLGG